MVQFHLDATESACSEQLDYAQLQKLAEPCRESQVRYSPAICMGARKAVIMDNPDFAHISASYAERQNLTMRMSNVSRLRWKLAFRITFGAWTK